MHTPKIPAARGGTAPPKRGTDVSMLGSPESASRSRSVAHAGALFALAAATLAGYAGCSSSPGMETDHDAGGGGDGRDGGGGLGAPDAAAQHDAKTKDAP